MIMTVFQACSHKKLTALLLHLPKSYRRMLTKTLKMMPILLQKMQPNSQTKNQLFLKMLKRLVIILQSIKNVSLHTYYRAVRVFCLWLFQEGFLDCDITQRIKLPKDDSEIVIPLTKDEVAAIDYYIINSELALRNYCIFHLMLDCGLRRQEVINLTSDCIRKNTLTIRNSKNNKSRIVLLPDFLRMNINNYLGNRSGFVFLDRYNKDPITICTIKKLFANIKNLPGMKRVHAHLLRHTFATSYLYYGGNMEMLRLLMGHSSYTILQNYVHLAAQEELIESGLYELDEIFFKNRRKN